MAPRRQTDGSPKTPARTSRSGLSVRRGMLRSFSPFRAVVSSLSVVDHLERGFWNEPCEDAAVDWRHQRIILPHQAQRPEPRQTGPPGHRQKLEPIAHRSRPQGVARAKSAAEFVSTKTSAHASNPSVEFELTDRGECRPPLNQSHRIDRRPSIAVPPRPCPSGLDVGLVKSVLDPWLELD